MLAAAPMLCAGIGVGVLLAAPSAPASSHDVATAEASTSDGSPNEVDLGFASDMSFHHQQALAMSQRVLGTDTSGGVQAAAAEILQTQAYEMGMLQGWLRDWGESTAPPSEVMAWMHAPTAADEMPGYATDAQMSELAALDGSEKGRLFLELMREHHLGGIHMASYAAEHAGTEKVRQAAKTMVEVQRYDLAVFDQLLAAGDT
jgi:uncharacterized protein (DUF305 family)